MKIDPHPQEGRLATAPLVVLTGAGISADSGIPTFRGQNGLWENYQAQDLATPEAFSNDPDLVWRFYRWRIERVAQAQPNLAHRLLVEIERALSEFFLITQNVDGLHSRAGSRNLLELHGSLWRLRCSSCRRVTRIQSAPSNDRLPTCASCKSLTRPDVVWFGETLNPSHLETAVEICTRSKTMLIIGTSAMVYPAAELPLLARKNGAYLVEINPTATPISELCHEVIREKAGEGLEIWWKRNQKRVQGS